MQLSIIVAASENNIIGQGNKLPWHLSEDLKFFKETTMGKPIVMGRKTYESIGKPLPGRMNIVLSKKVGWRPDGVEVVSSISEALGVAESKAAADNVDELFVIGGEQIYTLALPLADRVYLTRVHLKIEGDAHFADLSDKEWRQVRSREAKEDHDTPFTFFTYERI